MKTFLTALMVGVLACAGAPPSAQEKKSEPAKNQATKPEVKEVEKTKKEPGEKNVEKAEAKKDEGKKKVKKGGC